MVKKANFSCNINDIVADQRATDGYVNITALTRAYILATGQRRNTSEWVFNQRTQELLKHLSERTGIPISVLVETKEGRNGGTWIHPDLYNEFFYWFNRNCNQQPEKIVVDRLKSVEGGKREVLTEVGKIDLLTCSQLIEVKLVKHWKCGLGQVLIYKHYYPSHQGRLHLFGDCHESFLMMIRKHCERFNVVLTWEP